MNLAKLSISRPTFITSIVILILTVGYVSLTKLGVDLFPDVSVPVLTIQTVYPGAAPNDVETLVSKPIEDELSSMSGLKRLTSNNLESVSIVIAEFNFGVDIKDAEQQLRGKLQSVRRDLPVEIEEPLIRRVDPADQPIVRVAIQSNLPTAELYDVADNMVKPQFERIDGVGLVEILGGRKREVQVLVDKPKLETRELTMQQIAGRIQATSKNVPVGKVTSGATETVFRTLGEFNSIDAIKDVAVNFFGSDRAVTIGEIAVVRDGLEKEKTRSTLNGTPALFVDIYRQSGTNTVAIVDKVKKALVTAQGLMKTKNIEAKLVMVRDGSEEIRANIADVYESIMIGIVLCIIVVFFFLGSFRSTVITGLALPNSLLGAFILMYAMGFTVNIMTLLALSLAVGLLIDDAIVVRENIFRHMEMGKPAAQAAEEGTNEVAMAVVAVTAVVMAVFGPIAFLSGVVGQFFRQFGLTVVFAMAISLFDAMTIAPMLSAYWADASEHHRGSGPIDRMLNGFDAFQNFLERIYLKALKFTLDKPKTLLAIAFLSFIGSLALTPLLPKTFLPAKESGNFEVRVEAPPGTSIEEMGRLIGEIDAKIRANPSVEVTAAVIGNRDGEPNRSITFVQLKPYKQRSQSTIAVKTAMRADLASLKGRATVKIQDFDPFGGGQRPFMMNISGNNLDELVTYTTKVMDEMKKIKGFVDVDTNFRSGKPEYQIIFDRKKAEELGVSTAVAGAELRSRVEGVVPAVYRVDGNEYDIRVQFAVADQDIRKEFAQTKVPNVNQNLIPLPRVAVGKDVSGLSQINRLNKARFVQISGDIGPGGALGDIMARATEIMTKEIPLQPGMSYNFVGQAENFQELVSSMILAISLGIIFIYLVLASLYESFILPVTILLALPLAVSGAIVALLVTGHGIDLFSMIGFVMLFGVAVKNSILLVDYTLHLEREGKSRREALEGAAKTRLRPILMTSFALIAGTIPIAVGLNEASAQRVSMGITIIGGLISSTLLTLLVVPAAYGFVDDFRIWSTKLVQKVQGPKA